MFDTKANLAIFPLIDLILLNNKADQKTRLLRQRTARSWANQVKPEDMAGAVVRLHHLIDRILSLSPEELKSAKLVVDGDFNPVDYAERYKAFFDSAKSEASVDSAEEQTSQGEPILENEKTSPVTGKGFLLGSS